MPGLPTTAAAATERHGNVIPAHVLAERRRERDKAKAFSGSILEGVEDQRIATL